MRRWLVFAMVFLSSLVLVGPQAASASSLLGSTDRQTAADVKLDRFKSAREIYDYIAALAIQDPGTAIRALDAMLSQPDRHKRKTSIRELIEGYPAAAVSLLRQVEPAALASYILRDTRNSSPSSTLATLMVVAPKDAARLVAPVGLGLVGKQGDANYGFLEQLQRALIWVVNQTEDADVVAGVYREFVGELGKEKFAQFVESGWSNARYDIGHPDRRETLQKALAGVGLPPRAYDPSLLDESLLDSSILAEVGKTRAPLGQRSPWGLYLYVGGDNDLEWWEGYRQVLNLERIGSDPKSLQIVAMVDPYSSGGEVRDRVTLAMGKKASRPLGTTDVARVYYVEETPYAVADKEGRLYTLEPGQKVWVQTPGGKVFLSTIPEAIMSEYGTAPGGYPIVDKERNAILEWNSLLDSYPELKDRDVVQLISSPVLEVQERNSGDAESLVKFWELAMDRAPAERKILVISGHGAGISGIAWDYATRGSSRFEIEDLAKALAKMTRDGADPIDVLFLQACSMQDLEVARKLAPYARWIVGFEPTSLAAQNSHELLALTIKGNPGINAERVARTIVSARALPGDVMASAIDVEKLFWLDDKIGKLAELLRPALEVAPLGRRIIEARLSTPTEGHPDRVDLVAFAEFLLREMQEVPDPGQPEKLVSLKRQIRAAAADLAEMARLAMPQINVDPKKRQGLNGISIWFPLEGADWKGTGWISGSEYFSRLAHPAWAEFVKASTPLLSPVMRYDSSVQRLFPGNPSIWRFVDEVTLRPVVDGLVRLGEKEEGIYELGLPAARVSGYSEAEGGGVAPIAPDRDGRYRVWVKGFSWNSWRPSEIVPVRLVGANGGRVFEQGKQYHTLRVMSNDE